MWDVLGPWYDTLSVLLGMWDVLGPWCGTFWDRDMTRWSCYVGRFGTLMWDVLGLWYVTLIMLCGTFWDPDVGRFGTVVIGTLGSSWHVIIFYCFVISYVISSSPIWLTCYMDRFLKRPRANELSSPNNCVVPSKKPKPCAKQGDVSAAYRALWRFFYTIVDWLRITSFASKLSRCPFGSATGRIDPHTRDLIYLVNAVIISQNRGWRIWHSTGLVTWSTVVSSQSLLIYNTQTVKRF